MLLEKKDVIDIDNYNDFLKAKKSFEMKKRNSFFENLKYPFLIAEISANHNGSLKNCLNLKK